MLIVLLLSILTSYACCSHRTLHRKLQSFGIKYADVKEVSDGQIFNAVKVSGLFANKRSSSVCRMNREMIIESDMTL